MSEVIVYSKPDCQQCKATYRVLDKSGIEYTVIDVSEDATAYSMLKERGVQQMPAVQTADDFWTGFNPGKLKALTAA